MRFLVLASACAGVIAVASTSFLACSSSSTTSGGGGGGDDAGGTPDGTTTPPGGDSGPAAPYCPSGYTLTPFLTEKATTHTFAKADQVVDASKDYVTVLETDVGRIVLHLTATDTPLAANSFVFLALHHYFDGIAFHRVIDGFVAQGGDPNSLDPDTSSWGTGGPGYSFADELSASRTFTATGILAMANSGPATNGSQFFITLAALPKLGNNYTIFGAVTEGADVLPKIVRGEPPPKPTRITTMNVCQK